MACWFFQFFLLKLCIQPIRHDFLLRQKLLIVLLLSLSVNLILYNAVALRQGNRVRNSRML